MAPKRSPVILILLFDHKCTANGSWRGGGGEKGEILNGSVTVYEESKDHFCYPPPDSNSFLSDPWEFLTVHCKIWLTIFPFLAGRVW